MTSVRDDDGIAAPRTAPRPLSAVLSAVQALDRSACLAVPAGSHARSVLVDGVDLASAAMRPGALFAALPGARRHGAEFAADARAAGAVAMLSDRPHPALPTVVVRDPRAVLGPLAAWLYGRPGDDLAVHGVTGTNGKTSTCMLLAGGLAAAGRRPAWSTSLETATPEGRRTATLTTPEAPRVQAHLAAARREGARDAVLEVSSHGLALGRVGGTHFRTGVFTNLSADHLELHSDLEGYYAAKASLFVPERCDVAVVGVDDEYGRRLAAETRCAVVTVSARGRPADWCVDQVSAGASGTRFRLRGLGVDTHAELRLRHDRLLPYLRSLATRRLVVVAGITGEHDVATRADLGASIARAADLFVVTDESAHGDDPATLRRALAEAAQRTGGAEAVEVPDRADALARAVDAAGPGDVLAVIGRGAEQVLASEGAVVPFDDRAELHRALSARWGATR